MVAWVKVFLVRRSRASSMAKIGSGMPMATSLRPILAGPSLPMRTSVVSSRRAPAARAWPVQAATVGRS